MPKHNFKYSDPKEVNGIKPLRKTNQQDNGGSFLWEFECHCGTLFLNRLSRVMGGETRSCGCIVPDLARELMKPIKERQEKMIEEFGTIPYQLKMGPQSNNTSGVKGVTWDKVNNKWRAYISLNGKAIRKRFTHFNDAVQWRREMEKKLHDPVIKEYEQTYPNGLGGQYEPNLQTQEV